MSVFVSLYLFSAASILFEKPNNFDQLRKISGLSFFFCVARMFPKHLRSIEARHFIMTTPSRRVSTKKSHKIDKHGGRKETYRTHNASNRIFHRKCELTPRNADHGANSSCVAFTNIWLDGDPSLNKYGLCSGRWLHHSEFRTKKREERVGFHFSSLRKMMVFTKSRAYSLFTLR